jgi:hypothetical protein
MLRIPFDKFSTASMNETRRSLLKPQEYIRFS